MARIAIGNVVNLTGAATFKAPYDQAASFAAAVLPNDGGIVCPVLVAMGEFDPNIVCKPGGANEVFGLLSARPPPARSEMKIMEACGHASVLWRPRLCANVLLDFLCRHGLHPTTELLSRAAADAVAVGCLPERARL
eukprot:gnl/TRDRNA2_/TRDRNA2_87554_c0_seq2.p1 gnl/TRDRNA2_/TRDRNA2_87554_c0~~gnl/TRDRNA2_/TRDRNA2_87554_c0_seq2.p1  ORF type:complete len:137 (-),score=19.26 gnl/TRDRNA2_/TRDRNA2_87554_c0_seq2:57-467(-)